MKNLLISFFAAFAMLFILSSNALAAGDTSLYRVYVTNTQWPATAGVWNKMTFDVRLMNNTDSTLQYATGQYYYNFNKAILNGGTGSLSIILSDLPSNLQPSNKVVGTSTTPGRLQFSTNSVPGAGNGYMINPHTSILVMRVQLVTSAATFALATPDVQNRPYPTSPYSSVTMYNTVNTNYNLTTNGFVNFVNDSYNPTLPVELQSFSADVKIRDIQLKWHTATEVGVSHFEIQRSLNGSTEWVTVNNNVAATGGSNAPKDYSYTDKKLNVGKYAYRLKMVDNDGSFQYSKQTASGEVSAPRSFELSQNYPNPFNPSTKIDYSVPADAKVSLELYSINGQKVATLVNEEKAAGYYSYSFSANSVSAGLASGLYIYRIVAQGNGTGEKFLSVKKMILLK